MRLHKIIFALAFILVVTSCNAQVDSNNSLNKTTAMDSSTKTIYDFSMKLINGEDQPLKVFKGNVVLIVNVASECGYTPQYKELQATWEKYKGDGLIILGFPSNEFGGQEPGTNKEIETFCEKNYGVSFPLFEKIIVKGEGVHPLYQFLTSKDLNGVLNAEVKWNFNKFLIDKHGRVVQWYKSSIKPTDAELDAAIVAELNKP